MKPGVAVWIFVLAAGPASVSQAQSPGTFAPTGKLTRPREFHTATLLTSGKVLVAGGFAVAAGWPAWASAELYDPSTGAFSGTGDMTSARFFHTATLLADGKVLIAGGNRSVDGGMFSGPLSTAELYDPVTGVFTATGAMTTARASHTATLLNNGKVLIAGSRDTSNLASAELYDPSTGIFTTTGPMSAARSWHTATLLGNGKVLIDGGDASELYDADTGAFIVSGAPGAPRRAPGVGYAADERQGPAYVAV